jgi:hypothetical protein
MIPILTAILIHSVTPVTPQNLTCRDVRLAVALMGEAAAEQYASGHGATDDQIAAARACLRGHHHGLRKVRS